MPRGSGIVSSDCASTLREPYGRAAAMYLLDGLPVAAIAQKLGRPAPTVQNQLFRAKAILRKQIMERRQE